MTTTKSAALPAPQPIRQLGLVGKYDQALDAWAITKLLDILQHARVQVYIESQTAHLNQLSSYPSLDLHEMRDMDAVIVMGGDGTMIGVARSLCPYNIPLIGINHGRLGFITDISLSEMDTHLPPILQGHAYLERRHILQAQVRRNNQMLFESLAINDVVIARSGNAGMIDVAISINQAHMCDQRADGLIIATPTGSTAYALSVGGPIIHPQVPAWLLAPIAPHGLSHRPIAIPMHSHIQLCLKSKKPALLNCDTQTFNALSDGDVIDIKKSDFMLTFLHPPHFDYYQMLRQKLHWQQVL